MTQGSEHWLAGWQSYTASGWVYPYNQPKDEKIKVRIDKNGNPYIMFQLCTPKLSGNEYYFFPVRIKGISMCKTADRLLRFGDFINIVGFWEQRKVALSSWNGKTRLRDWMFVTCTRFNKMPHVRTRDEIDAARKERGDEGMVRTLNEVVSDSKPNPYNFDNK